MNYQSTALAVSFVLFSLPAFGQVLNSASVSNTDITKYKESPAGQLVVDSGADLTDILQGTATAAGGNVELFTSSDTGPYSDTSPSGAFASVTPTSLTAGFDNGQFVSVRGLNGSDWFVDSSNNHNTAYGADNLANRWFSDFLVAMVSQGSPLVTLMISGNEKALYDEFLANDGFPQMSDPNISYIQPTGDTVNVGLGGFFDSTARMATLLGQDEATLGSFFPSGIQVSEAVIVNGDALYSFLAVNSGVVLNDGASSYSGTYEVTTIIPEPSTSLLAILGVMALLVRKKRQ